MSVLFAAADGTAFRVKLPISKPVKEGFDACKIDVAFVADTHAYLLATDEPLCQHLLGPHQLLGDSAIGRLVVGDVLYLLPGLYRSTKVTVSKSKVKAERWQLAPSNLTARKASYPLSTTLAPAPPHGQRRWGWGNPAAFAIRSWAPPPQGYGPLTLRTSKDQSIVAAFPQYCAGDSIAGESVGQEDYGDLTIEQELRINIALAKPINFTRYVDYLPQGDAFPNEAVLLDRRLAHNSVWCVKQDLATFFKATRMEPGLRMQAWQLLTAPHLGVPGTITSHSVLELTLAGMVSSATFIGTQLQPGGAVLKLIPAGDDYACQPQSAWPEASYLFNNWRIVVEQEEIQGDLYRPLATSLEAETAGHPRDKMLLNQLAEIASAERGPGHIIYGKTPYWDSAQFSGIGIRLRDGGSRLHLDISKGAFFVMPGDPPLHSRLGRFDGQNMDPHATSMGPVYVPLRVDAPKEPHDVVLKVNESATGNYDRLEYALRPRDSCKPIKADEWLPAGKDILDEWVICFFVNLAKVTWGCLNGHLLRPSAPSAATVAAPPPAAAPSSSDQTALSPSDRESKKQRLS